MYRLCFAALVLLCQYGCAGTVTIERRLESHLGLLNYYDANKGSYFLAYRCFNYCDYHLNKELYLVISFR